MYVQVVFNLPIDGPFDYLIPSAWQRDVKPGMRVRVSFGRRICIGYAVGKIKHTQARRIKPILKIIDDIPVLDKTMLKVTYQVAGYYACSWGEAIEAAIPANLRSSRRIELDKQRVNRKAQDYPVTKQPGGNGKRPQIFLLQDIMGRRRRDVYFQEINATLNAKKGVIFLTPDAGSAVLFQKELKSRLNREVGLLHSCLSATEELRQWMEVKNGRLAIVAGTRMAVFAPVVNLGLIIIEEEQNPVYKQDSTPHYHAAGVARIRAKIEGAKFILSSRSPALETWYQAKKGRIKYILRDTEIPVGRVKIIDLHRAGFFPSRRKIRLSISLEDAVNKIVRENGRVLLFLNRRGFAVFASCQNCGMALRCPRCNANLTLHFQDNKLACHRCNYRIQSPRICPNCNSGYIRYTGLGTERLESELHRLYPQAGIARVDKDQRAVSDDAQITVATESIFRQSVIAAKLPDEHPDKTQSPTAWGNFDLVGVISVDFVLNQPDFRAGEKVFDLMLRLYCLSGDSLAIQTNFPGHYCFQALVQKKIEIFYEAELAFRRQARLPPFTHIIAVKLRGKKEQRVSCATEELFKALNNSNQDKSINIVSHSVQIPYKKRDRFHEQILIKVRSVIKAVDFLKKTLNGFRHSGIIITVDVDPV